MLSLLLATYAHAKADIVPSFILPASAVADTAATYTVKVSNIGNMNASSVSVSIQLPVTHTSPQVYVMGTLGAYSSTCAQSGTKLNCNLGTINKNTNKTVTFSLALPQNSVALGFSASATTTSAENSIANNSATATANVSYSSYALTGTQVAVTNDHCTGTNLTSYYECTLFPSSISSHNAVLEADGTVTIPGYPDYYGYWGQDTNDHLWFEYWAYGALEASFEGNGVPGNCFDGLTTFPGSSYVSPYEVCF
ncbi:MAG TPA: hypothetical protein PLA94_07285 [Myxococcota bacterium]|nr:hypothetical protein [Myxococcota bacterium]HND29785.1 hypothetical protein [Myxococcota bacterium]